MAQPHPAGHDLDHIPLPLGLSLSRAVMLHARMAKRTLARREDRCAHNACLCPAAIIVL